MHEDHRDIDPILLDQDKREDKYCRQDQTADLGLTLAFQRTSQIFNNVLTVRISKPLKISAAPSSPAPKWPAGMKQSLLHTARRFRLSEVSSGLL